MIKKMSSLVLVTMITASFSCVGFADALEVQTFEIDGKTVEVEVIDANGYRGEIVRLVDDVNKEKSKIIESSDKKTEILEKVDNLMVQEIAPSALKENNEISVQNHLAWGNPIQYNEYASSSQNSNAAVLSQGKMNGTSFAPFYLNMYDGFVKGVWLGSGFANSITLSETYTFKGIAVSISYPAGVSVQGSNNQGSWQSPTVFNTTQYKAYRPDMQGFCPVSLIRGSINSRVDVLIGNTSYPAEVSIEKGINDFLSGM